MAKILSGEALNKFFWALQARKALQNHTASIESLIELLIFEVVVDEKNIEFS